MFLGERWHVMAINVFEGARRISKLVAIILIIGWIVGAFNHSPPPVHVTYRITGAEKLPVKMAEECPPNSMIKHIDMETKSGTKVLVKLCREKSEIAELLALAEYLEKEDIELAERALDRIQNIFKNKNPDLTEIAQLEAALVKADAADNTDEAWIDARGRSLFLEYYGKIALWAISSLFLLWAFTWVIGWIVRGFMGIPRGQDKK